MLLLEMSDFDGLHVIDFARLSGFANIPDPPKARFLSHRASDVEAHNSVVGQSESALGQ
jgi:hypothetical protein